MRTLTIPRLRVLSMRGPMLTLILALFVTCLTVEEASAQAGPPVVLVMKTQIVEASDRRLQQGRDILAKIRRMPVGEEMADVLEVHSSLQVHELREALRALSMLRARGSLLPGRVLVLPRVPRGKAIRARAQEESLLDLLRELRSQPPTEWEILGRAKVLRLSSLEAINTGN